VGVADLTTGTADVGTGAVYDALRRENASGECDGGAAMYGTVARMRVKAGAEAQLDQLSAEFAAEGPTPGMVGQYVFRSEADPREYWLAVAFTSKEAYRTNAESPEQHARYERLRALLETDPEWHDGDIVVPASAPTGA
jgi:quinol monooxygenase YgiN